MSYFVCNVNASEFVSLRIHDKALLSMACTFCVLFVKPFATMLPTLFAASLFPQKHSQLFLSALFLFQFYFLTSLSFFFLLFLHAGVPLITPVPLSAHSPDASSPTPIPPTTAIIAVHPFQAAQIWTTHRSLLVNLGVDSPGVFRFLLQNLRRPRFFAPDLCSWILAMVNRTTALARSSSSHTNPNPSATSAGRGIEGTSTGWL